MRQSKIRRISLRSAPARLLPQDGAGTMQAQGRAAGIRRRGGSACSCAVLLGVVLTAFAGSDAAAQPASSPSSARERLLSGLPRSFFHGTARELIPRLQLDDGQVQSLAQFIDHHQQQMSAQRRLMRDLRNKLADQREARAANDTSRIEQLEAEIADLQAQRRDSGMGPDPLQDFLDDVESILTEEQKPKFALYRQENQDRRLFGDRIRRVILDLPATLELDGAQKQKYDELLTALRAEIPGSRWNAADPAGVEQDILGADERGEYDVSDQIRARIAQRGPRPREALEKFFKELETTLNDGQRQKLAGVRQSTIEPMHARAATLRAMLRAVHRLKLSATQSEEMHALEDVLLRQEREARGDADKLRTVAAEARTKILQILDGEQQQQFDRLLASDGRRPTSASASQPAP